MARHKVENGVKIMFTLEEETARDVEEADRAAKKPMNDWKDSMQATDSSCPRWFEDYITENSITLANGKVKDSYDAKVARRAEKP